MVWKKKDRELASAEVEARKKRIGLWSEKSPVAPWEWRKGNRSQNAKTGPKKLVPTKEALSTTVYITKSGKKYHALELAGSRLGKAPPHCRQCEYVYSYIDGMK